MTSRRRRTTRTTLSSTLIVLGIAVAGYALHAAGLLPPGSGAGPTTAAAPTPTDGVSDRTTIETAAPTPDPTPASRPTGTSVPAAAQARAVLASLPVKGQSPATGYDRTRDFGSAWLDVDRNGCDTRNDVLARDLAHVVRNGPCRVLSGELVSPYSATTIAFQRGETTSILVQIDHVVALENAWRTGAQQLTQAERQALANDPENLFAVDQHANAQKRSGDAATWLPANTAFRCTYVEHQITVKSTYRLWVAPAERDAMARVLDRC